MAEDAYGKRLVSIGPRMTPRKSFSETFAGHGSEVVEKSECYSPLYDDEFARFVERGLPVDLLEIGTRNVSSLEFWAEHLPEGSNVVGICLDENREHQLFLEHISILISDGNDRKPLDRLLGSSTFDIVLDDGSQVPDDVFSRFEEIFALLNPDGIYVVKDFEENYWSNARVESPNLTALGELFKKISRSIESDRPQSLRSTDNPSLHKLNSFSTSLARVCFSDSLVIIKKLGAQKTQPDDRAFSTQDGSIDDPATGTREGPRSPRIQSAGIASESIHRNISDRSALKHAFAAERVRVQILLTDGRKFERERDALIAQNRHLKAEFEALQAQKDARISADTAKPFERSTTQESAALQVFRLAASRLRDLIDGGMRATRRGLGNSSAEPAPRQHRHEDRSLVIEDRALILNAGVFDEDWYTSTYPQARGFGLDPIEHYLTAGHLNGCDPNPYFNGSWYLETYPDAVASGMSPLVHYLNIGIEGGRDPGPHFDTQWYLSTHRDVAAAGINPLGHYLRYGSQEDRNPSVQFSAKSYRQNYMTEEEQAEPALLHYLRVGVGRGYSKEPVGAGYAHKVLAQDQGLGTQLGELCAHIEQMVIRAKFWIVQLGGSSADLAALRGTLRAQLYTNWTLCSVTEFRSSCQEHGDPAREQPSTLHDYVVVLEPNDRLHPTALYSMASAIEADPDLDMVYVDDDVLDADGRRGRPFYKPDWSPDYLESCNYLGSGTCIRMGLAWAALETAEASYDYVLRATEGVERVRHIRQVLVHRASRLDGLRSSIETAQDVEALSKRLQRTHRSGTVAPALPGRACYTVQPTLQAPAGPLVSVIIPTAAHLVDRAGRQVDLIMNCMDKFLEKSTYRNIEFVVVENGDIGAEPRSALAERNVKLVAYSDPEFNLARKLNLGARSTKGDYLLLLSHDVEPLAGDWIERMLAHLEKPHVGVVGAKLLYPDMTLQHAGIVLNCMMPDHVRPRFHRNDQGYFFSTAATRNFTAVTGSVMLTRTETYWRVGGYTEELAVNYNDVDFCLKLREIGLLAVYEPQAELIHHEAASSARTVAESEAAYFQKRWAHITQDPYYNEEQLAILPPTYCVHWNGKPIG